MSTLGYVIATPKIGKKFTEFYFLGLEGQAIEYPKEMRMGEQGRVLVGIVNREQETVSYWVRVTIDGATFNEIGPLVLHHEDKWEQ